MSFHALTLLVATVTIVLAVLVTNWIHKNGNKDKVKRRVRTVISLTVTIVWITTVVAEIVIAAYTVSPLVHAIMGAIVGYFFTADGLDLLSRKKDGK